MTNHTEHDPLTGIRLDLTMTLAAPINLIWDCVSDVTQIGRFSPECFEATWIDAHRFLGRNRFPEGHVREGVGVVTERKHLTAFAWTMLDREDEVGSFWRYDLSPGTEPGTTVVHHSFEHGPGHTGLRDEARVDRSAISERLARLAHNMSVTLFAMELATVGA
ncbi:MAG TPA: SRPBCC family protein [Acidimicrobiales bacterium]|nr:SRPBCC family protein [Acidimicrobiales bacterium]